MARRRWSRAALEGFNKRWRKLQRWARRDAKSRDRIAAETLASLPELKKECCGKRSCCKRCPRLHAEAIEAGYAAAKGQATGG